MSSGNESHNTTIKKLHNDCAYIHNEFVGSEKLETWISECINYLKENHDFDDIEFEVISLPISLIKVPGQEDPIPLRAEIEMEKFLNIFYPPSENNNKVLYHDNITNKNKLKEIIINELNGRPSAVTKTSSQFKLISGNSYLSCNSSKFINVLLGKGPDGEIRRIREFKDSDKTENDVDIHRQEQYNKHSIVKQVDIEVGYFPPEINDLPYIISGMSFDKKNPKKILINDEYVISSVKNLIETFQSLIETATFKYNNGFDEDETEFLNSENDEFIMVGKRGKQLTPLENNIYKLLVEQSKTINVPIDFTIENLSYIPKIIIDRMSNIFYEKNLRSFLIDVIFSLGSQIIKNLESNRNNSDEIYFIIEPGRLSLFYETGKENPNIYLERIENRLPVDDTLSIPFMKTVFNAINSKEKINIDIPLNSTFHIGTLVETVNKINGSKFLSTTQIFDSLNKKLVVRAIEKNKILNQIEVEIDEEFGPSKVVPFIDLPPLVIKETNSENIWLENTKTRFYSEILKIVGNDSVIEEMYREYKKHNDSEFISTFNEFSSDDLIKILEKIDIIDKLTPENNIFTPKIDPLEYTPKDGIGLIMKFQINDKMLYQNGKFINSNSLIYADGAYDNKITNEKKITSYFDPFFRKFSHNGIIKLSVTEEYINEKLGAYLVVEFTSEEDTHK